MRGDPDLAGLGLPPDELKDIFAEMEQLGGPGLTTLEKLLALRRRLQDNDAAHVTGEGLLAHEPVLGNPRPVPAGR
jgi:hypothetical protein